MKGVATVDLLDGSMRRAEVHWFEAHGIGKKKIRIKRFLDWTKPMKNRKSAKRQFAICIRSDDPDLLTPRMIYEVLPDEKAAKVRYLRVLDNEGEDYLYPADYFALIDFPRTIEDALVHTLPPSSRTQSAGVRLRAKAAHRSA